MLYGEKPQIGEYENSAKAPRSNWNGALCVLSGLLRRLWATVPLRFVRRLPRLRDLGYNKKIAWGRGPLNAIGAGCPSIAKETGEPA